MIWRSEKGLGIRGCFYRKITVSVRWEVEGGFGGRGGVFNGKNTACLKREDEVEGRFGVRSGVFIEGFQDYKLI